MFGGQDGGNQPQKQPHGAKKGIDVRSGTKARAKMGVSLREEKRKEALDQKRGRRGDDYTDFGGRGDEGDDQANMDNGPNTAASTAHITDPDNPWSYDQKSIPEIVPLRLLPTFAEMAMNDEDAKIMFHGVLMVRKLLSVNDNPPIQAVVDSGIVPRLVSLLVRDDWVELQFEAAWAVSNVASGTQEHTHLVIREDAVPQFVRLLESPNEEVREQATWAIGNIAGDSSDCRNYILSLGAMPLLLKAITIPVSKVTVLRNTVWALSNLCRSKPPPPLEAVAIALPTLHGLLNHHDKEVITDACWAISYISDGSVERIQRVLQSGVMERVIGMLTAPGTAMQTPALRTIGNIVTGNDQQTQAIIDMGALHAFHFLLCHPRRAVKKEAAWCLSNIMAGSVDQVQACINNDLYRVVLQLMDAPEYEVKKEAVWCIANTTSGGTMEQLRYLVDVGVLPPLCRILQLFDVKIVGVALEAIENFLSLGVDDMKARGLTQNPYAQQIVSFGGLELIEALQQHPSPELYNQSIAIVEMFFDGQDERGGGGAGQEQQQQYDFSGQQQGSGGNGGGAFGGGGGGGGGYNFAGAFGS